MIKNYVKTHKRALKSRISLGLRPRPLSCPLNPCKTPPYFSNSGISAPLKFSLNTPLLYSAKSNYSKCWLNFQSLSLFLHGNPLNMFISGICPISFSISLIFPPPSPNQTLNIHDAKPPPPSKTKFLGYQILDHFGNCLMGNKVSFWYH